jgi:hypothetical protein
MKLYLSIALTSMLFGAASSKAAVEAEMLYSEYPDAFVCLQNSGGNTFERIYTLSIASKTDVLRYDGPNANELIHFFASTGEIVQAFSPPTFVDCVIENMSIRDLVENGRALNMFSPMPTGSKF